METGERRRKTSGGQDLVMKHFEGGQGGWTLSSKSFGKWEVCFRWEVVRPDLCFGMAALAARFDQVRSENEDQKGEAIVRV